MENTLTFDVSYIIGLVTKTTPTLDSEYKKTALIKRFNFEECLTYCLCGFIQKTSLVYRDALYNVNQKRVIQGVQELLSKSLIYRQIAPN